MANKQISELTAVGGMDGTELFHLIDASGNSRKVTLDELKTFVNTDPSIVPSSAPYRGARAYRTANLNISNGVSTAISWMSDAAPDGRDTDGIWNIGSPNRLVVPTGVTKVRLAANLSWANNSTGFRSTWMMKNGATFHGRPLDVRVGNSTTSLNIATAVIDVTSGDYFELWVYQNSGSTLALSATQDMWFAMDIVEAS